MTSKQLEILIELRANLLIIGICYMMNGPWKILTIRTANKYPKGSSLYKTIKKVADASPLELEYLIDATLAGYKK